MGPDDGIPREVTPLTELDLRQLADMSDPRDVHLSVYLPTASHGDEQLNRTFVASRVEAIRDALEGDVERGFEETFEGVEEVLFHDPVPGERGRVVFASAPASFLRVHRIAVDPGRRLVLDNSPFILPLLVMMDDHEDYAIVLMDSDEARVYHVRSRALERIASSSIDLMNRHKKGGMSQKRFNRLRRGAIDAFISQIVEDLEGLEGLEDMRGLVVAGPGDVKKRLADALPKHLRDMVIGMLDVPIEVPPDQLLARGEAVAAAHERASDAMTLDLFRKAIFKDELAAVGLDEVRDALVQGRVDTLLIAEGLVLRGWICESCKRVFVGETAPSKCPGCGGIVSGADIVNELLEMAERTDAGVEIIADSQLLASMGGLGAILRY